MGLIFPLKKDYDRVNTEFFDPRIVIEDYEPHEEAAKVRGYIPETSGNAPKVNDDENRSEREDAQQIAQDSPHGLSPLDERSLDEEGVEKRGLSPEIMLFDGRSSGREESKAVGPSVAEVGTNAAESVVD